MSPLFWRCPPGWRLPGGYLVDWLAAGTYDRRVGLSLMTFQVTHHIARHIDIERDHIFATLSGGAPSASVERIAHFAGGYHARNGGPRPTVTTSLPHIALSILVLLALTSPRARQCAIRR